MLIDACRRTHAKLDDKYVLRTKLDKAVCDYKKQQKLHEKDVFHYRTIFALFPDLREFIDSDNPESCLLAGLEDLEDMKQPEFYAGKSVRIFYFPEGFLVYFAQISIPYERSGALRESNYSVLVLNTKLPDGQEKRDYFLCMDNRPLVTLLDWHDYNRKKGTHFLPASLNHICDIFS